MRICCTLHHSMATCQPHNHLSNKIRYNCGRPVGKLRIPPPDLLQLFSFILQSLPSICSDSPQYHLQDSLSIPTTSINLWFRRCFGRHEGSSEREGFGCGQFQKITQEAPPIFTQCRQQTGCILRVYRECVGIAFSFLAPNTFLSLMKVVDPWLRHSLWTPKFKLEAHLLHKRMNSA